MWAFSFNAAEALVTAYSKESCREASGQNTHYEVPFRMAPHNECFDASLQAHSVLRTKIIGLGSKFFCIVSENIKTRYLGEK